MIKVLHIINGADLGGISSMILNYYRNIDRNQYHFDFIYSIDEPLGHNGIELQKLGAEFFYVPKKSEAMTAHVKGVRKILREGNYDAIHVHSNMTSYVALSVAKRCGVKIRVAHAHNAVKGSRGIKSNIKHLTGVLLNNLYSTIRLGCSQDALNYVFGSKSIIDSHSIVLPNSITTKNYSFSKEIREEVRSKYGVRENELLFGTVGRMSKEKNIIYLIDVLDRLVKMRPCKLMLIGDGDERKGIEEKIDRLGLRKNVILTGQRSDVAALLNAFDVFTIPSENEGFSIAGLEAGANGLPLVMSDAVPSDLGFLPNTIYLSLGNTQEWAETISSFYRGRNENAQNDVRAHGYDIENSVSTLEAIYSGQR